MTRTIPRREFLRTTSAAAGSLAYTAGVQAQSSTRRAATEKIRIGSSRYVSADYPIQALPPTKIVADGRLLEAEDPHQRGGDDSAARGPQRRPRAERQRARGGHPLAADASRSEAAGAWSTRGSPRCARAAAAATAASRSRRPTSRRPASATCSTMRSRPPRAVRGVRDEEPAVLGRRARRDQLPPALSRHPRQETSRSRQALSRHPRARELGQPQPPQPVVQAGARADAKPWATR